MSVRYLVITKSGNSGSLHTSRKVVGRMIRENSCILCVVRITGFNTHANIIWKENEKWDE